MSQDPKRDRFVVADLFIDLVRGEGQLYRDHERQFDNPDQRWILEIEAHIIHPARRSAIDVASASKVLEVMLVYLEQNWKSTAQERFELAERMTTLWSERMLVAERELGKVGAVRSHEIGDVARIEGLLVDALEEELEDYQSAPKSWAAVTAALDGLRRRDEEIVQLRAELAKRST